MERAPGIVATTNGAGTRVDVQHGVRVCTDAMLRDSLRPCSWSESGPLPTGVDGLAQSNLVSAIVEPVEAHRVVQVH